MIVISSSNGIIGIKEAINVLENGGSALDAVEKGIRQVEQNPDDHSVGFGGLPNILGEVELDASIMNGLTLETGAVGALKGFMHPISIARKVMEKLPHVLLVGGGAARFASECGFEKMNILTSESEKEWHKLLNQIMPSSSISNLTIDTPISEFVRAASEPETKKGTVNFIAQDRDGNICSGVSTSGWFAKYPGRLGDSPIIGAGNYADNRYGAAACTGMGEMSIRACTAHSLVLYLKMGLPLAEAGLQAMQDLNDLGGDYLDGMNIIAIDKNGNPAGFSNDIGKTYIYIMPGMKEPAEVERLYVPTHKRWGKR